MVALWLCMYVCMHAYVTCVHIHVLCMQKHLDECMVLGWLCFFSIFYDFESILNKSVNATLQYFIFCEKVLDKKYLLMLNNVSQTSSKRFVEIPPICPFLVSALFSFLCFKLYSLNFVIAHAQKCCLSELVILVLH